MRTTLPPTNGDPVPTNGDPVGPFSPLTAGDLDLPNRIVLAPMTRLRSDEQGVPGPLVAKYYAQRASMGLLISEGVFPSAESKGYPSQPARYRTPSPPRS